MQFMISVTRTPENAESTPPKELAEAEFEAVRQHYMDGLIRQIWLRADGGGGLILVEAASAEIATDALGALPMVRAGFLKAPDVIPLAPYWGFAPRN